MLLSQTAHYALRAVYYLLANDNTEWHLTKDIAKSTKIPAPYLARILSTLAKRGILQSRTGMGGGFCIGEKSYGVNLYEIINQFDNLESINDCVFGFSECRNDGKCILHDQWIDAKKRLIDSFKSITLKELKKTDRYLDWTKVKI